MLLTIDSGTTNVVFAVFDRENQRLKAKWRDYLHRGAADTFQPSDAL